MRNTRWLCIALSLTVFLLACGSTGSRDTPSTQSAEPSLAPFPATYEGGLPCADCSGVRHTLNLFDDGVFYLRMTWLGEGEGNAFDRIGRWSLDSRKRTLSLGAGKRDRLLFALQDGAALRQLDRDGHEIDSTLNYSLARQPGFVPFEPALRISGMYVYFADAANFEECQTGRRYPVVFGGDSLALEKAYLEARAEPMAPVLAKVDGRIAIRKPMEGPDREMLIVERFINVAPDKPCDFSIDAAFLQDTVWRPVRVLDVDGIPPNLDRQPFVELISEDNVVSGFTGCNTFSGSYSLENEIINFGALAATRRYCAESADFERALLQALNESAEWQISENRLLFFDHNEKALAEFQANVTDVNGGQ